LEETEIFYELSGQVKVVHATSQSPGGSWPAETINSRGS